MTKFQKIGPWLAVLALAWLCASLSTHHLAALHAVEVRSQDLRQVGFAPRTEVDSRLAIVAITEATLQQFPYRSPVDRGFLAGLLRQLDEKKPKAIYLDVLFDQATEKLKDDELAWTLRTLKTPLVVGYAHNAEELLPEQSQYMASFVPPKLRGAVNLATDPLDGTVRWIYDGQTAEGIPSVPQKMADILGLTVSHGAQERIDWRRPKDDASKSFATFPAHNVKLLPAQWFEGKVILIGATLSMEDRHRTPFDVLGDSPHARMPGVEIFAHQLAQTLDGRRVYVPGALAEALSVAVSVVLGLGLACLRRSMMLTVSAGLLLLLLYWVGAIWGYGAGLPMLPLVPPSLGFALALFMSVLLLNRRERSMREFVQSAFSKYLDAKVVEQLVAHPEKLSLAGQKKEMSFIFTDIEGFTTMSERLTPEMLAQVLNQYLSGMCEVIARHGGLVDKFIGDAVMCFFNAPLDQDDHADRAIECALELDSFCQNFRQTMRDRGIDLGVTRIGVHSGTAVVGNFGAPNRMDYTALGDTVNAASRTEGVNKYIGTRICVTEATAALVERQTVGLQPVGDFMLKGKKQAITLYQPVPKDFFATEQHADYMRAYEALAAGHSPLKQWTDLQARYPQDPLVAFHKSRLEMGEQGVVIEMTQK